MANCELPISSDGVDLIPDKRLTPEEKSSLKQKYGKEYSGILKETSTCLSDFIMSDFGKLNEKAPVGEINAFFGIPGDAYSFETFKHIIWFQKTYKLGVDGIAGPKTLAKLRSFSKVFSFSKIQQALSLSNLYSQKSFNAIQNYQRRNNLDDDGIIGKKTLSVMRNDVFLSLEKSPDIKSVLQKLTNTFIKKYLHDLTEYGKIELSPTHIRNDIIQILRSLQLKGSEIFSPLEVNILIDNFLEPPLKGKEYIQKAIDLYLSKETDKEKEFSFLISSFKGVVGSIIDIAKKSPPGRLQKYIKELQNFPEIKKLFEMFPELENLIITVLPTIAKNIDKSVFLEEIGKIGESIQVPYTGGEVKKEDNLRIANTLLTAMKNILGPVPKVKSNKETAQGQTTILQGILQMQLVQKSPLVKQVIETLNIPSISPQNKHILAQNILGLLITYTQETTVEKLIDEKINDIFTTMSQILEQVEQGSDQEKVVMIFIKVIEQTSGQKFQGKTTREIVTLLIGKQQTGSNSFFGTFKTIRDNWSIINNNWDIIGKMFYHRDSKVEVLGKDILFNVKIFKNMLERAGGNFISIIKRISGGRIDSEIESYRDNLFPEKKWVTTTIRGHISMRENFTNDIFSLIREELVSGGSITLQGIQEKIKTFIRENKNEVKKLIKENIPTALSRVPPELLDNIIENFLEHPKIDSVIRQIIKKVGSLGGNSKNISEEIGSIIKESTLATFKSHRQTEIIIESFSKALKREATQEDFQKKVEKILSDFGLQGLDNVNIFGGSFGSFLVSIVNHVSERDLNEVFKKNKKELITLFFLNKGTDRSQFILTKICLELIAKVETNKKTPQAKELQHLQKLAFVIKSHNSIIQGMMSILNNTKKTKEQLGAVFDALHIVSKRNPQSMKFLIDKFYGSRSSGIKSVEKKFVSENFGFSLSHGLGYILGMVSKKELVFKYLNDRDNRKGFINTLNR